MNIVELSKLSMKEKVEKIERLKHKKLYQLAPELAEKLELAFKSDDPDEIAGAYQALDAQFGDLFRNGIT